MADPVPKAAALRRRVNKQPGAMRVALERAAKPPCPVDSDSARAWWDRQWDSPIAAIWTENDVPAVTRLVRLLDVSDPSAAVLAEIRQLEDRFGLSPLSRRRLQWEVSQATGEVEDVPVDDGGRWLRAVSD